MALEFSAPPVNGTATPTTAEDEELYTQLLQLRDAIISGKHSHLRLPQAVVDALGSSLDGCDGVGSHRSQSNGANRAAFATNSQKPPDPPSSFTAGGLPGLNASTTPHANGASSAQEFSGAGLDPIFLEKSESLVKAEGQLRRQRLERDLQTQVEQRRHTRDRDTGPDAPSQIDLDVVLSQALARVKPRGAGETTSPASSIFDENDYYSSLVESDWSSEARSSKGSDRATGAFHPDFERLDEAPRTSASRPQRRSARIKTSNTPEPAPTHFASRDHSQLYTNEPDAAYDVNAEDDEYSPPDATAFDTSRGDALVDKLHGGAMAIDEDSDYEPGEISLESNTFAPHEYQQQHVQPSPAGPVIRNNHLTHLAAPQPNRVSPLATAKGAGLDLELINGRPEVAKRQQKPRNQTLSRVSSASPSGNGVNSSSKKRRNAKRKRDAEPSGRVKRRHRKQAAAQSPVSPKHLEPVIKDEPVSPPAFADLSHAPPYDSTQSDYRPTEVDLSSPAHVNPSYYRAAEPEHAQARFAPRHPYQSPPPQSGLRYEYSHQKPPGTMRVESPSYRPAQRDSQDLRRVATHHQISQRPLSPVMRDYSLAPNQRTVSMTYGDPRSSQAAASRPKYDSSAYCEQQAPQPVEDVRSARSRSPLRVQGYSDPYASSAPIPGMMPPPPAPPRQIVVDQYGNRYYAADPEPQLLSRAPVAPPQVEAGYTRTSSRMSAAYPAPAAPEPPRYEPSDARMGPPLVPASRQAPPEQRVGYRDSNHSRSRDYSSRPSESTSYQDAPTSPDYREAQEYDPMLPPPAPQPPSAGYAPRSYSVRPEEQQYASTPYSRQGSVIPTQYIRQEAPPPQQQRRAMSVMPGSEYGAQAPQGYQPSHLQPAPTTRGYSQAPQQQSVRYVDAQGNEVYPREVRQFSDFRYQG